MLPAIICGIAIWDAPVSYWPSSFPVPCNSPRSLCESELGPGSLSFWSGQWISQCYLTIQAPSAQLSWLEAVQNVKTCLLLGPCRPQVFLYRCRIEIMINYRYNSRGRLMGKFVRKSLSTLRWMVLYLVRQFRRISQLNSFIWFENK